MPNYEDIWEYLSNIWKACDEIIAKLKSHHKDDKSNNEFREEKSLIDDLCDSSWCQAENDYHNNAKDE